LPSRKDIESVLKNLKNNKADGADSIAAELLKNGGPQLVDAQEEVIQLAWTSEKLPESWTKGVLCPVYKKGDKLDCTNYRGISLLNVAYKVYYTTVCYHRSTRSCSITKLVSSQANQRQTNSLHCVKSLKKAMSTTSKLTISS
jgi:hypothetical protein